MERLLRRALLLGLVLPAIAAAACASGTTQSATEVTDHAATFNARGSAGGEPTTYWFQYGLTTSYGSETPHRNGGSGSDQKDVSERVTTLQPDTTYHFRACASNASGSGCAADRTFRTGSPGLLPGFQETTAFSGLEAPVAVRFAPDGRVFVAEKPGAIKVFDGLGDATPTTFANFRPRVNHHWDRGMLGLALDPDFPAKPFVYVLYTHDAPIGGTAPTFNDTCSDPMTNGCVVSARLSRLTAQGNQMVGEEQVLIEDWCQQAATHTIGDLRFGADGALYVSGGDAASPDFADYGQFGIPRNPCGDPPVGVGGAQTSPTSEGGALRSQDLRTPADPTTMDGAILRVDPETGEGFPGNPLAGSVDRDARRVIAYGLRNPYRFALRPGTNEIWIGDVGWNLIEEINRITSPTDSTVENFGWPCYEGNTRLSGFQSFNICQGLYAAAAGKPAHYLYRHSAKVTPEDNCSTGSSSVSGMTFTPPGSTLPAEFDGALFFADYARDCIWTMRRMGASLPNEFGLKAFRVGGATPVDIQFGPGNDLYYANAYNGSIKRIHYTEGNQAPRAVAAASPTSGGTPLNVSFDGTGSSDPDGDALSYAWDLDGDDAFDDSNAAEPSFTYNTPGSYPVRLRVTDTGGATATDTIAITAGNTPPTAVIAAPTVGFTWKVGDPIDFDGSATDQQSGTLPASALSWSLTIQHCPSNCHTHAVQDFPGVASGSFDAPDHEYPSYLELKLTATDPGGLSDSQTIRLDPRTVNLSLRSNPSGLQLAVNGTSRATPFTATVIQGSANTLSAPTPQTLAGTTYDFGSWSDGGLATHTITANSAATYTATYTAR